MLHFLFPTGAHPDSPDEMFADQMEALTAAGFSCSLGSGATLAGMKPLRGVPHGSRVVYRGWMMNAEEYGVMVGVIERCGATPFTGSREYLAAHHLPNWYPLIPELTPETRVFPAKADLVAELRSLGWGAYFLKDYVKSLKTGQGSVVRDPSDAPAVVAELREYRGEIEGGICARRVEEFEPVSERRYFVLNGVPCAADGEPVPDVVRRCAERIPGRFYSVDVVRRADGELRVVEVGDGQCRTWSGGPRRRSR